MLLFVAHRVEPHVRWRLCRFHSNIAQGSAGALHAETSSVFAEQVEFYNNSAIEGSGGALFLTR